MSLNSCRCRRFSLSQSDGKNTKVWNMLRSVMTVLAAGLSVSPVNVLLVWLSEWRMCSVFQTLWLCLTSWDWTPELLHTEREKFQWEALCFLQNCILLNLTLINHSGEALMGWLDRCVGVKWDTHFLFRCCRALSRSEEWDQQKEHLASDECNYVSASNNCRSVWSSSCDALCLWLFTVKLCVDIFSWLDEQNAQGVCLCRQMRP